MSYITLVSSKCDPAGRNMVNYLRNAKGFSFWDPKTNSFESKFIKKIKLHISNFDLLNLEELDKIFPESRLYVFLSKHSSKSRIPALTCHFPGNFSENAYGGNYAELAVACPFLQKQYIREVTKIRSLIPEYQITIEATHHGPTSLNKPVIFIEIGSTALEWKDEKAATIVCDCLLRAMDKGLGPCAKVGIGLGGTHYPVKLNKLLVESEYGLAAVAAKHNLRSIDEYMLRQMVIKSAERVKYAIVDLKGLGKEKHKVLQLLEKTELEILKI